MTLVNWLWIIFAIAFALGGVILLVRALFADRSRGRKRCPKCWYDMTGATSLRCSECGREVKSERRLYRTHRHWRAALLGVVLMLTGLGTYYGGEVHREGWVRATPTVVYIAALPWLDSTIMMPELKSRVVSDELSAWQHGLLMHRCVGLLRSDHKPTTLLDALELLSDAQISAIVARWQSPWMSFTPASEALSMHVVDSLSRLIDHEDARVRKAAIRSISLFDTEGARTIPMIVASLFGTDLIAQGAAHNVLSAWSWRPESERTLLHTPTVYESKEKRDQLKPVRTKLAQEFGRQLADCQDDDQCASQTFLSNLGSPESIVRAISAYGVAVRWKGDQDERDRLLSLINDEDQRVRLTVLGALARLGSDEQVRELLLHTWRSTERHGGEKILALHVAARYALRSDGFRLLWCDEMLRWLANRSQEIEKYEPRVSYNQTFATITDAELIPEVLDFVGEHTDASRRDAAVVACFLGSGDPDIRSAAALACARLKACAPLAARGAMLQVILEYRERGGREAFERVIDFACQDESMVQQILTASRDRSDWHAELWIEALGLLGASGVPALPDLQAMLNDPDPSVGAAAAEAIQKIEWACDHPDWRPSR